MLNRLPLLFLLPLLLTVAAGADPGAEESARLNEEGSPEITTDDGLSRMLKIIEHINDPASASPEEPPATPAPPAPPPLREAPLAPGQRVSPPQVPGDRPDAKEREELGGGRWRRFRTNVFDANLDAQQRAEVEALESLGYFSGSMDKSGPTGVIRHDPEKAQPGVNVYTSGHAPEAFLMDMAGKTLHRWHIDFWTVWPDFPTRRDNEDISFLRRAYLQPDGSLLAIFESHGLVKVDRDSALIWDFPGRAHHDLDFLPNGDLAVLTREAHIIPRVDARRPVLEDFISVLDPTTGEEKRRVSLLEAMERSEYRAIWDNSPKRYGDIFHTNTLRVFDGSFAEQVPAFRAGNVMTSFLWLDTIAVVDMETETLVWAKQGDFKRQHDPKQLPGGNVLVFDNRGRRELSAVYEYDPLTWEVVWEFKGSAEQPFYTSTCGAAHRQPNGNTLIVESDGGRAFEVTRDKEIVWEFVNPHRAGDNNEYIATLFNVDRFPAEYIAAWHQPAPAPAPAP